MVIDGGYIGSDIIDANHIDGTDYTLPLGLVDSHSYPVNLMRLADLTQYGVTPALVMSCPIPLLCASLRSHSGVANIRAGSLPAAAINSIHDKFLDLNASIAMIEVSQAQA